MAGKKYLADWAVDEQLDPRSGRIVRRAVYRGEWYEFAAGGEALRRTKRLYACLSVASAAAYLAALCVNAPCAHEWYSMFPFALMMLPVFFVEAALVRLLSAGPRVTRENRDKLVGRYAAAAGALAILAALALIGHAVYWVRCGETARDTVFLAAALILLGAGVWMLAERKRLEMRPCGRDGQ